MIMQVIKVSFVLERPQTSCIPITMYTSFSVEQKWKRPFIAACWSPTIVNRISPGDKSPLQASTLPRIVGLELNQPQAPLFCKNISLINEPSEQTAKLTKRSNIPDR
ncbi:Zinc/cadmium/lead-transporting P-type ATPase [Trichinella pseudospiralis]